MNNLYPIDPSLDLCLQDVYKNSGLITCPHQATLNQLVIELASQSCFKREKILFVFAQSFEKENTISNLKSKLCETVLDLINPDIINESGLRALQNIKKTAETAQIGTTHLLLSKKQQTLERKQSKIQKITDATFGQTSIRELVWKLRNGANSIDSDLVYIDLELRTDVLEFSKLNEQIIKASQIYKPGINKLNQLNSINTQKLINHHIQVIYDDLKHFEIEFTDIIAQLKTKLSHNKTNLKSEFLKAYDRIHDLIFELNLSGKSDNQNLMDISLQSKLFGLKSNPNLAAQQAFNPQILKELKLELSSIDFDQSMISELASGSFIPENILAQLEIQKSNLEKTLTKRLRQLNTVNSASAELSKIDQHAKELIEQINASEILEDKLEDNSFNIFQKISFLVKVLDEIQTNLWIIKNQTLYIEWQKWFQKLEVNTKQIIEALAQYPTNQWKVLFQDFYLKKFINENLSSNNLESLANDSNWAIDKNTNQELVTIINEVKAIQRLNGFENLKKTDPRLYNMLLRKTKEIPENWLDILLSNPNFVSDIFPVIALQEYDYNKLTDAAKMVKIWNKIIFIGFDQFESINLDNVNKNADLFIFISNVHLPNYTAERLSNFIGNKAFVKHDLKINYQLITQNIFQTNLNEKLISTEVLASKILTIKPKLFIYKTKNDCFLSFLDPAVESYLVKNLEMYGPKCITIQQDRQEALLDVLVDDTSQIHFITQDNLLHPGFLDSLKWQYDFIHELRLAGFNQINLSSTEFPFEIKNQLQKTIAILLEMDQESKEKKLATV